MKLRGKRMTNQQIKFYVTDDERKQIELRAAQRYLKAPTFAKLSALGVELSAPEKIYVEKETVITNEIVKELEVVKSSISDDDLTLLEELDQRIAPNGFFTIDSEFQLKLKAMAQRFLAENQRTHTRDEDE